MAPNQVNLSGVSAKCSKALVAGTSLWPPELSANQSCPAAGTCLRFKAPGLCYSQSPHAGTPQFPSAKSADGRSAGRGDGAAGTEGLALSVSGLLTECI